MLNQKKVFKALEKNDIHFFTGVPDSYLNGFCNYLINNLPPESNIIAANEGNAVAIAAGHYIATGEIGLVYMQNSGMGNAANPLISLADKNVYSIPMILLIGWRGQPSTGDWAQHKLQGEITPKLLEVMNIPYTILEDDEECFENTVKEAVFFAKTNRTSYALIAPKGIMAGEKINNKDECYPLSREEAIETVIDNVEKNAIYCATTGRATRELFFIRERRGEGKQNDFLNVGSMGHASSVALGIAQAKPHRKVVCLDGDCAAMMHMGSFTTVSKVNASNLLHIVLNNGAHESVGGQPSAGFLIDFTKIAEASGYKTVGKAVTNKEELVCALKDLACAEKPSFIEVRIHKGLNGKLPALDFSHRSAIDGLMNELRSN